MKNMALGCLLLALALWNCANGDYLWGSLLLLAGCLNIWVAQR